MAISYQCSRQGLHEDYQYIMVSCYDQYIIEGFQMELIININKMSIYSGFATRQQEQAYDSLVIDLISVLQRRIIKFYVGEEADQPKFHSILTNLQTHFSKMEQNKYLQPKISNTFRQLINLTSNVVPNQPLAQLPSPPQSQQQNRKLNSVPKQSLNFSTDRLVNDLKRIGKIRHQPANRQDGLSSRGQTNPQNPLQKDIIRSSSTHVRGNLLKKNAQKWGSIWDNDANGVQEHEKKNLQYIIREYVNKGPRRRQKKKAVLD